MSQPPQMPPAVPPPAAGPPPGAVPPTPPVVVETKDDPGLLIRAIWFVFVGWWASGIVASIAWFCMITIIGLPLGIWLVNRLPTVITLRPRTRYAYASTDNLGNTVYSPVAPIEQLPWPIRGIWFLLVGWWASAITMAIGWALLLPIITIPLGLLIFNRVPFVASLYRY